MLGLMSRPLGRSPIGRTSFIRQPLYATARKTHRSYCCGRTPSVTSTFKDTPSRTMVNVTVSPGFLVRSM
jgi:hypothetical protein